MKIAWKDATKVLWTESMKGNLAEENGDKKRGAGRVGGWREEEREPGGESEHWGGRKGGVYMAIISNVSFGYFWVIEGLSWESI